MAKHSAAVPNSLLGYLKSWGPGIVVVLTWLGAGDVVNCSVSGAGWGYNLMWALALALLVRFTFVSIMAKYQLCNPAGETIMAGYARLGRWAPLFIAVATILFAHLTNSYMAKGAGEAWHEVMQCGSPAFWSLLCCIACVAITGRGAYGAVEKVMYVFLAGMSVVFVASAMLITPDLKAIAEGLLTPRIPAGMSVFGAVIVVISLIGGVGGSLTNLMYPYMMREKGWTGPQYRRVQVFDLLLSVLAIIVINVAVWVIAAEVLHPQGRQVETLSDIAHGLRLVVGRTGEVMLYFGVFGAVFTSWVGVSLGYAHLFVDCLHQVWPARAERYGEIRQDPLYRPFIWYAAATPMVWTLPGMPSFVYLTILVNALIVLVMPVLVVGLFIIANNRNWIGPQYVNRLWENVLLVLLIGLTIWASLQLLREVCA